MASKQQPFHQIRVGNIRASIWEQLSDNGPFLTVTFSRSYKDKQDQWKNAQSYGMHDLEAFMDCAVEAREWMCRYWQTSTFMKVVKDRSNLYAKASTRSCG